MILLDDFFFFPLSISGRTKPGPSLPLWLLGKVRTAGRAAGRSRHSWSATYFLGKVAGQRHPDWLLWLDASMTSCAVCLPRCRIGKGPGLSNRVVGVETLEKQQLPRSDGHFSGLQTILIRIVIVKRHEHIDNMVRLTMSSSIVEGLQKLAEARPEMDDAKVHEAKTDDAEQTPEPTPASGTEDNTSTPEEPSLDEPAVGNPITHSQVLDLWRNLKQEEVDGFSLESLLRGAKVYIPPPPPKPEPVRDSDRVNSPSSTNNFIAVR